METWTREQIKADETMLEFMNMILQRHETPGHTVKNLVELMHVPNVCELTTAFGVLPGDDSGLKPTYFSYDFNTWIKSEGEKLIFPTRIESITLYESFIEYESTRVKEISAAHPDDRDAESLNLN